LRYTGLRTGDAVSCSVDRLVNGKLRLYTQKTGTHVHCPLPEFVVRELEAIPRMSEKYWFWTGNGKLRTAVGDWQGRLADLFSNKVENRKSQRKTAAAKQNPVNAELSGAIERKPAKNNLSEGHAHRFRDTFAVELLLAGVPLGRVSILLGHQSVKITEKHYRPWIRELQEQAEADVRRTWSQDLIALMQSEHQANVTETNEGYV
jgi:integrase